MVHGDIDAGGTSAADIADVICTDGLWFRNRIPAFLRNHGMLGVLHDYVAVHGVPHTEGARRPNFQKPCDSGDDESIINSES